MITGKKYHQDTVATFKDGVWTVTIGVKYSSAEDGGDWEHENEFSASSFGPTYEEAFQGAVEEVAVYLVELSEEEETNEQLAVTEDSATS